MNIRKVLNSMIVALIFGAFLLLIYYVFNLWILDLAEKENSRSYEQIQQTVTVMAPEQLLEETVPMIPTEVLPEYQELAQDYSDFAGWISIYGTDMSLPVMQEQQNSRDYYLTHNYRGEEDSFGCPFIPYNGSYDSDNVIVYGHNMRHEQMFGLLHRYTGQTLQISSVYGLYESVPITFLHQ